MRALAIFLSLTACNAIDGADQYQKSDDADAGADGCAQSCIDTSGGCLGTCASARDTCYAGCGNPGCTKKCDSTYGTCTNDCVSACTTCGCSQSQCETADGGGD